MSSEYLYDLTLEITVSEGKAAVYKMQNLVLDETRATGLYAMANILISQMYGAVHFGYGTPLWSSTELDYTPLIKALDEALEKMVQGTDLVTTKAEMPKADVSVTVMRHIVGYEPTTRRTDNL